MKMKRRKRGIRLHVSEAAYRKLNREYDFERLLSQAGIIEKLDVIGVHVRDVIDRLIIGCLYLPHGYLDSSPIDLNAESKPGWDLPAPVKAMSDLHRLNTRSYRIRLKKIADDLEHCILPVLSWKNSKSTPRGTLRYGFREFWKLPSQIKDVADELKSITSADHEAVGPYDKRRMNRSLDGGIVLLQVLFTTATGKPHYGLIADIMSVCFNKTFGDASVKMIYKRYQNRLKKKLQTGNWISV